MLVNLCDYKQSVTLIANSGVQFLDFGIDPDFAGCIDGLVLVDSHRLKPAKRARYLGEDNQLPGERG